MKKRLFLVFSSLFVWAFAFYFFKPWWSNLLKPVLPSANILFWKHALIFSLPTALLCGSWWYFLIYKGFLPKPLIIKNFANTFKKSSLVGFTIVLFSYPLLKMVFKFPSEFHFDLDGFLGNFFSNFWEEIVYRGLLFQSFATASGSIIAGAIASSAIFGFTHDQYPLNIQIFVGCIGFVLCMVFQNTKNFIAPVWAHNIADWILDLFF